MGEPEGTFVDYQTTMVKTAKAIAVTVQEMVSRLDDPLGKGGLRACGLGDRFLCRPPFQSPGQVLLPLFPPHVLTLPPQVTKSTTNPDELGVLANQLTSDYGHLALQAKPAALTAENEEVREGTRVGGGEGPGVVLPAAFRGCCSAPGNGECARQVDFLGWGARGQVGTVLHLSQGSSSYLPGELVPPVPSLA